MDILRRSLAPINDEAWAEIDAQAQKTLRANLTARRFVDVVGPKGWNYEAVGLGRLDIPAEFPEDGVKFGVHLVQPLVEAWVPFELSIWELDNLGRGAKDIELTAVIEAAQKIAQFEEKAIYYGFKEGNIVGLDEYACPQARSLSQLPKETRDFFIALHDGVTDLQSKSVEGPYMLVINPWLWNTMSASFQYPLQTRVESLTGGAVIPCPVIDGALLVSARGGDLELVLGQEFSIGYESHDRKCVRLFITESFTFRVLDPTVFVRLRK